MGVWKGELIQYSPSCHRVFTVSNPEYITVYFVINNSYINSLKNQCGSSDVTCPNMARSGPSKGQTVNKTTGPPCSCVFIYAAART